MIYRTPSPVPPETPKPPRVTRDDLRDAESASAPLLGMSIALAVVIAGLATAIEQGQRVGLVPIISASIAFAVSTYFYRRAATTIRRWRKQGEESRT